MLVTVMVAGMSVGMMRLVVVVGVGRMTMTERRRWW